MKLNDNSWHYWVNTHIFPAPFKKVSDNLCNYFWGTFFRIFFAVFVGGFLLFLLGSIVHVAYTEPKTFFSFVAFLVGVFVLIFGFFGVFHTDNLTTRYIKSKKEKYCPMIEWVKHAE